MDPRHTLNITDDSLLEDPTEYRKHVGQLLYLTITRPNITFSVHQAFLGDLMISWRAKKRTTMSRCLAEVEYRNLGVIPSTPTVLFCENQAHVHIASNPRFHERTEHIKIDCHFVREHFKLGSLKLLPVRSSD